MTDNRTISLVMDLFKYRTISLYELSLNTGVEKDVLLESLKEINQLLRQNNLPAINLKKGIYSLPLELTSQASRVFDLFRSEHIYLSQKERISMIYLYTFCRRDFISNFHYQDLLSMSRNTILADIKELKALCQTFELEFNYSRSKGYYLLGREEDKHRLTLYAINVLLHSPIGTWALAYLFKAWQEVNAIQQLKDLTQRFVIQENITALEERLDVYLYFLQFFAIRYKRVKVLPQAPVATKSLAVHKLVASLLEEAAAIYTVSDLQLEAIEYYLASIFQGAFEGELAEVSDFFQDLTLQIVEEMERLSLIEFQERSDMILGLQRHLIPAYYRLMSRIECPSDYTEVVKKEHADLFQLVKKALKPLENHLGFDMPDSEVSYFVIHFGGYLEREKTLPFRYRALIVCPNGISSSLILKEMLKQLFPNIAFLDTQGLEEFQLLPNGHYDLIFSTIPLENHKPVFVVPQLMSERQKRNLFRLVNEHFPNAGYFPLEIEQLLETIKKYASIHEEQDLKYELVRFMNRQPLERKEKAPMLDELITRKTYAKTDKVLSWQEAIALAAQPLLAMDKIEETYIKAMIDKVHEFGPFIDLGKGVAIPHARPDEGVKSLGMSMLSLEQPVYLLDDPAHEIRLLICIAAIDNQTHLKALTHLTAILRENENIKRLVEAKDFDEIADLLKKEEK
ncbi:BglG family transcription antiterminator [Streptococcus oricebi]|uniref:PTS sugar transporter subunit IIC n=1 Tax=Streptococcus oricebi TaxID=1547447 RepID=A0ABS5B4H9_9STRE|nr:BglG family transcription antiterminator [Streptococcus oricebi]MBP2623660.1 PTS sugar transporter subunit IIC [Streptococcus oricebi]